MSIVRSCLRLATVAALRDLTWAEARVYDSDFTPLDQAILQTPSPYVVVFTDDDTRSNIEGRAEFTGNRKTVLVIEMGIAAATTMTAPGEKQQVVIPATDASYELAIDMLEHQVIAALLHNPEGRWSELFRSMVMSISAIESHREGEAARSARYAARQLVISVDPIADPTPGVVLVAGHPILDFVTFARTAPASIGISASVELIMQSLPKTNAVPWRQAQARLGLTAMEARGGLLIAGHE